MEADGDVVVHSVMKGVVPEYKKTPNVDTQFA